jgi:hypothetical protein
LTYMKDLKKKLHNKKKTGKKPVFFLLWRHFS